MLCCTIFENIPQLSYLEKCIFFLILCFTNDALFCYRQLDCFEAALMLNMWSLCYSLVVFYEAIHCYLFGSSLQAALTLTIFRYTLSCW